MRCELDSCVKCPRAKCQTYGGDEEENGESLLSARHGEGGKGEESLAVEEKRRNGIKGTDTRPN